MDIVEWNQSSLCTNRYCRFLVLNFTSMSLIPYLNKIMYYTLRFSPDNRKILPFLEHYRYDVRIDNGYRIYAALKALFKAVAASVMSFAPNLTALRMRGQFLLDQNIADLR